jgi:nicotinic acetylcholine receptor
MISSHHLFILMMIYIMHLKITMGDEKRNRLFKDLFENSDYNPKVVPTIGQNEAVQVHLSLQMIKLQEVNTKFQFISITGWIEVLWKDYRLTWNASDYGGINKIVAPTPDVWVPTFVLANSASEYLYNEFWYSLFKVVVYSDGTMKWTPGGSFLADCPIDVNYFPFDEQICQFRFENWVYTGETVNLTYLPNADAAFLKYYNAPNGQWDIVDVGVARKDKHFSSPEPYPRVYFGIHVKRKSLYFVTNIIFLSIMLAVLVLFIFKLPPESGERISMGVTLLLAFSVFLLMISERIPETSSAVPVISVYLICFMGLTTLCICESVFVIYCYHHNGEQRVPQAIASFMATVTCDKKLKVKMFGNRNTDPMTLQTEDTEIYKMEWQHISRQIDIFCFWLFLSLFVLISVLLLIILPMTVSGKLMEVYLDNWMDESASL